MKTRFLWLTIFFLILFCLKDADACSCRESKPPCGGINKTSIVFSGEVLDVTVHPEERTEAFKDNMPFIGVKAQVKVLEAFSNLTAKNLIVETGTGGGDCGFDFKAGEKYLIYAYEFKGRIITTICSRTKALSKAQNDVEILRELKAKQPVKSRIFGNTTILKSEDSDSVDSLPKVKITAKNEAGKTFTTETDSAGNYRIIGLPAGTYKIQATYKSNFTKEAQIQIKPKSGEQCAEENFYFGEGGRITGKVVDGDGKPIARLRVIAMRLVFSEGKETEWTSYDGYTDENGKYEIEGLPNGKYYLGFNFFEPIEKDFPFPPTFYPQVNTKQEAARISVTDELSLDGYDFVVNSKLPPRLVTGIVTLLDGKPAKGAKVEIKEERTTWRMDMADVDEEGNFSLTGFDGQSYYLYVYDSSADWGMNREAKKIYIPKTGEVEKMAVVLPIFGKIEGTITDENGQAIKEADLFLQCSAATGLSEQRISDWEGTFSFPLFEGCNYKVYAKIAYGKLEGLQSEKIEVSKNDIGKPLKVVIRTKK
jgi:hypothetical protein